jgi:hypothetical protein
LSTKAPADLGIHDLFTFASIRVHSRFSIFLQRVGAAGRIALPEMKEVSRKMRDTAGGTPALPLKKRLLQSTIHDPFLLFAFIRIYSRLKTVSTQYLFFFATLVSWR